MPSKPGRIFHFATLKTKPSLNQPDQPTDKMLTTTPHLYIRRPSPTTAEFTVTTYPPLTLLLRLALFSILLLRISIITAGLTTIYTRFFFSTPPIINCSPLSLLIQGEIFPLLSHLLYTLHTSTPGQFLSNNLITIPSWALLLSSLAAIYYAFFAQLYTTESLLVLRGLGIQTSTGGWGRQKTRFIPTEKIRDVLINETFRGFEIRYYLIVLVEGEEDVVVVFPRLLPRKKIVEAVWRGVRGCLFEGEGTVGGRKDGHV
ncbi:phosphatidylinositol N-acetylglucosaminyltransferase subunit gpi15 [Podospora fimiseda]|uniref:Phosphatidylinositol N-acetylglucosaminyltransferase subunit gpi15 n=1 Tax=Podospora fimiseda TaxID=252190 RepID=A0AAN7GXN1_9PEZI|nr:phosphatidylinositol N-acetylglucosaminyltransferase subunit gpi15 [Podospora fimiseda]